MPYQRRDIFPTIAKGRHFNRKLVQAVEEVFAKVPASIAARKSRFVAATTRTFAEMVLVLPITLERAFL